MASQGSGVLAEWTKVPWCPWQEKIQQMEERGLKSVSPLLQFLWPLKG